LGKAEEEEEFPRGTEEGFEVEEDLGRVEVLTLPEMRFCSALERTKSVFSG
jgi:hypothetical protein